MNYFLIIEISCMLKWFPRVWLLAPPSLSSFFFAWKVNQYSYYINLVMLDFRIITLFGHTDILTQSSPSVIIWKCPIFAYLFLLHIIAFLIWREANILHGLMFQFLRYKTLITVIINATLFFTECFNGPFLLWPESSWCSISICWKN